MVYLYDFSMDKFNTIGRERSILYYWKQNTAIPNSSRADRIGLKLSGRLGQAFERRIGIAPSLFREMNAGG